MDYRLSDETIKSSASNGSLKSSLITAAILLLAMTILTGVIYPLVVTGIAKVVFPAQANGSIVKQDGKAIGSELIGQTFESDEYFHGRPSAAGDGYDAAASSGSNLGPTNKALIDEISKRADAVRAENGLTKNAKVPSDLVTASGSGLDPDISPDAAYIQVKRIAEARKMPESKISALIDRSIEGRTFGVLGEKRVNVLQLNLELDKIMSDAN